MLDHPVGVYINWSAYDELSDAVELTEDLALRQLDELLRLRRSGVRLDYYLMDAFWFARDGGYRTWRKPHWPDGPDRWLDRCLSNGVKPGLWVATNSVNWCKLDVIDPWRSSLAQNNSALCLFFGGYLEHFIESLDLWYARGVRLYKFDFASLDAAPESIEKSMLPSEIRAANITALSAALKAFRLSHPEVVLLAYNGFEEQPIQGTTSQPIRKSIDARWLEVFDAMYCGDPRPADVPAMSFWRSKDVYSDHMVRAYELNALPLSRIDSSGFMIGTTGTCYYRGKEAWKGMLLLSLARGGWANTYYGNLDLLDEADARWFAKAQSLYLHLQQYGRTWTFGGLPGEAQPYGFVSMIAADGLVAAVNPSQQTATIELPAPAGPFRMLFHDAGFVPQLTGSALTLGPEQMALVGAGSYADGKRDLGVQDDVVIPRSIEQLDVHFAAEGKTLWAHIAHPPQGATLRIIVRQTDAAGRLARRTSGGSPPKGRPLGQLLRLSARQGQRDVPVRINYDKAIWSGLSWAAGEIAPADIDSAAGPVEIRFESLEPADLALHGQVYAVRY